MKVLTLTQPWATLVALKAKNIETRSWSTSYRGRLAIHAAKGFPKWARDLAMQQEGPFKDTLVGTGVRLPLGAIVATCRLVSCMPTRERVLQHNGIIPVDAAARCPDFVMTDQERAFGDYEPGRWAWLLADIKPLATPIPAVGRLGLWEFEMPEKPPMCKECGCSLTGCACG